MDHANELGLPADKVWSGTSGLDAIDYFSPSLNPFTYDNILDDQPWIGRNPSAANFGAQDLPTGMWSMHGGYWSNDDSLNGMAKVVAGKTGGTR